MKKYVKPELFYEHFELSQHIAGTCNWDLTNLDVNTCAATGEDIGYPADYLLFTGNNTACKENADLLPSEYCYMTGTSHEIVLVS